MNLASLIAQLRTGGQGGPTSYGQPGPSMGPHGPQGPQLATGGPVYGQPGGGYQGPQMGPQGPGMSISGGPPQIPQGGFPQGGGGSYGAQAPPAPPPAPQAPGQPGPGNNGRPWDQRRTGQGFQPGSAAARQWRRQNPGQNPNRPQHQAPPPPGAPTATNPTPLGATPLTPDQWRNARGLMGEVGPDGTGQVVATPPPAPGSSLPPTGPQFTGGPQPQIDPRIAGLLASMGIGGGQGPTWGGAPTPDPSKWWMPYWGGGAQQGPPPPAQPAPRTIPVRR